MRFTAVLAGLVALAMSAVACGPSSEEPSKALPDGAPTAAAATTLAPAEAGPPVPAMEPVPSAGPRVDLSRLGARVPRDAAALVVLSSLTDVMTALGRDRLVTAFEEQYEDIGVLIDALIGHDITDPTNLPKLGIAADQPLGAAFLATGQGVALATLTDRKAFLAGVASIAENLAIELVQEPVGDAILVRPKERDWNFFVVHRDVVVIVGGLDGYKAGHALAKSLAVLDKGSSLAGQPRLAADIEQLGFGGQVLLWADPAAALRDGRAPLLGKVDRLVAAVALGTDGIRFKALLGVPGDAAIRRVLRNEQGAPVTRGALHPTDLSAASKLVPEQLIGGLGKARPWVERASGMSAAALGRRLTGAVALTFAADPSEAAVAPSSLDVSVAIGVAEPEPFRAMWDRLVADPVTGKLFAAGAAPGTAQIVVPEWGTLHATVDDKWVRLTTAPGRPVAGPSEAAASDSAALAKWLSRRGRAVTIVAAGEILQALEMVKAKLASLPVPPPLSDDSDAAKAALTGIREASAGADAGRAKVKVHERAALRKLGAALGDIGVELGVTPEGVVVAGGLFLRKPGLPASIEGFIKTRLEAAADRQAIDDERWPHFSAHEQHLRALEAARNPPPPEPPPTEE